MLIGLTLECTSEWLVVGWIIALALFGLVSFSCILRIMFKISYCLNDSQIPNTEDCRTVNIIANHSHMINDPRGKAKFIEPYWCAYVPFWFFFFYSFYIYSGKNYWYRHSLVYCGMSSFKIIAGAHQVVRTRLTDI